MDYTPTGFRTTIQANGKSNRYLNKCQRERAAKQRRRFARPDSLLAIWLARLGTNPHDARVHPMLAEVLGTAILILIGNGVVANVLLPRTKGHESGWIVITIGWAMAVFVAVLCSAEASGAHLNPAVTVGLAAAGQFPWTDVAPYVVSQVIGAMLGASLVFAMYRDHYDACDNANAKLATFCTGPAIRSTTSNVLSEVVATFVLVFAVLMTIEPTVTFGTAIPGTATPGTATPEAIGGAARVATVGLGTLGALPVALVVLAIGMGLGGTTGYAINPARDLGPRLAHAILPVPHKRDSDWSYAAIPAVAPLAGGVLAALLHSTCC